MGISSYLSGTLKKPIALVNQNLSFGEPLAGDLSELRAANHKLPDLQHGVA
jgi:hypothetical protein